MQSGIERYAVADKHQLFTVDFVVIKLQMALQLFYRDGWRTDIQLIGKKLNITSDYWRSVLESTGQHEVTPFSEDPTVFCSR